MWDGRQLVTWSAARLVDAAAADVANPFDDVMVAVVQLGFEHLQIANLQTRWSERNLRNKTEDLDM